MKVKAAINDFLFCVVPKRRGVVVEKCVKGQGGGDGSCFVCMVPCLQIRDNKLEGGVLFKVTTDSLSQVGKIERPLGTLRKSSEPAAV